MDLNANTPAWEGGRWARLSRLRGDTTADVCVVGLGGSGLAAVHALLDAGARVVGITAREVAGGAAGRNGGFLLAGLADFHHVAVELHGRERAAALYRHTVEQIARMHQETPTAVRLVGSLRIAADDDEARDCGAQLEAMNSDGLPVEAYSGDEGSGLLIPSDGVYHPLLRCRLLAREATDRGARLYERTPAVEFDRRGVRTGEGRVLCSAIIVTVDGALDTLIPELRGRVRSARLQMLGTAPELPVRFSRPVYTRWGYDYWQQLPDGRVLLGGQRDQEMEREWTFDATPTPEIQERLERLLRGRLGVAAPVTHRWAATVSYSGTRLPLLEEVRDGLFVSGAYSGTGNVLGAVCGRAAAELALTGRSEVARLISGDR
jgi:gamma-glutamylputrescine oxidase